MPFEDAKLEAAYLKMGFYGSNGSGKTYTASKVAIGLAKHIKAKKPVFFFDTETGSDYVIPMFEEAKVKLKVSKSRSFGVLMKDAAVAAENGSILLIDSITHVWDEVIEAFKKRKKINRLFVQHWMEIKPEWREFTEFFVTAPIHIIVCGRSGDVWEEKIDDEGVREMAKTGTRMRTEKELGYEPSLLVEMTLERPTPHGHVHQAWVAKDRFDVINFKTYDDPGFDEFLPHIELLNLGGEHRAFDKSSETEELFNSDNSGYAMQREREALLDEIKSEIQYNIPGQDAVSKKAKADILFETFGTKAWTRVEQTREIVTLKDGLDAIKAAFKKAKKEEAKRVSA